MSAITNKMMLASLRISVWTAHKHDKKISHEVAVKHNATEKAGRYNKNLAAVGGEKLKEIWKAAHEGRMAFYKHTLPWSDDGNGRILPATNYLDCVTEMREKKSEFELAVDAFVPDYPAMREANRLATNGMFSAADYPDERFIKSKFGMSLKFFPMLDAQDFRVELAQDDVSNIRQDIEREVQTSIHEAVNSLYERLHEVVKHMADKLSERKPIFRDSLIANITEVCAILLKLNLTDDPMLNAMLMRVEDQLTSWDANGLRKNHKARKGVAERAAQIEADLKNIMSGGGR